ncbi:MAG: GNAT family N-acetyltransferase [Trueperella sp.]|nr:GNAT family N-acetyltransferase [Trueperella sp.]
MSVELVDTTSPQLAEAFARLIPQLSRSAQPLNQEEIADFLAQDAIDLLVFFGPEREILGMLTLVTFDIPTGTRSWVEDVVVDAAARGQGAGGKLVAAAVARARERGAKTVDLTSRPEREAANRLYRRSGFVQRETNVYRHNLDV